jgi:hypothetical protein
MVLWLAPLAEMPADQIRFSDVTHQVCKVTAGNRVVLTYNLVHDRGTAAQLSAEQLCGDQGTEAQLRQVLELWKDVGGVGCDYDATAALIYMLDHKVRNTAACRELPSAKCETVYRSQYASGPFEGS